jgi:hypothetical protein
MHDNDLILILCPQVPGPNMVQLGILAIGTTTNQAWKPVTRNQGAALLWKDISMWEQFYPFCHSSSSSFSF